LAIVLEPGFNGEKDVEKVARWCFEGVDVFTHLARLIQEQAKGLFKITNEVEDAWLGRKDNRSVQTESGHKVNTAG